jgi:hypothetical protein
MFDPCSTGSETISDEAMNRMLSEAYFLRVQFKLALRREERRLIDDAWLNALSLLIYGGERW